jgi:hypothetical protein
LRSDDLLGSGLRCELVSIGILLSWHSPKFSIHAGRESELSHRSNGSFFPARAVSVELAARCFVSDGPPNFSEVYQTGVKTVALFVANEGRIYPLEISVNHVEIWYVLLVVRPTKVPIKFISQDRLIGI